MLLALRKILPFSVTAALLSTLIYMTFNPIYYLSASFPITAFSANLPLNQLPVKDANGVFFPRISTLNPDQTKRILNMVESDTDTNNKNPEQLRQELNHSLQLNLSTNQQPDMLMLNFYVKKNISWLREYKSFLSSGLEFTSSFDKSKLSDFIEWKTDYMKALQAFFISLIIAGSLATGVFFLSRKMSD